MIFVVEQNRDAQLRSLLILETGVDKSRLRSILHYNGLPIPASYVTEGVAAVIAPARPAAQLVG
jgi:2-oxoglutarate/2-oxoacid ferredoxin oxidoreductase subunit alpha